MNCVIISRNTPFTSFRQRHPVNDFTFSLCSGRDAPGIADTFTHPRPPRYAAPGLVGPDGFPQIDAVLPLCEMNVKEFCRTDHRFNEYYFELSFSARSATSVLQTDRHHFCNVVILTQKLYNTFHWESIRLKSISDKSDRVT